MKLIYTISIIAYGLLIKFASLFNKKAQFFVQGRKELLKRIKNSLQSETRPIAWFHFASLGEFEQGRPVLEKLKKERPELAIFMTFFSPSGYEIRKDYPEADYIFYLPLDTPTNAKRFIEIVKPQLVFFTKYEYWYYYFSELKKRRIPLYMISAIFRKQQIFFRWYGGFNRSILTCVTHFFVQDKNSGHLLKSINFTNWTVSGDTRFDRVYANSLNPKHFPVVEAFAENNQIFIAGSTWPKDDELLIELIEKTSQGWKFIIAPHEIKEDKILNLITKTSGIRYSELVNNINSANAKVLIIDNIGMLSSLYSYGDIAYIGGGFSKSGIHNTIEAAVFGMPVLFGPNYQKFKEAVELVEIGAAFPVSNTQAFKQVFQELTSPSKLKAASEKAAEYVKENTQATTTIFEKLSN
ncbi:3-deoxy-D-manno-octulosonic acid transferase [Solitalea koreensis]|uniref:3-deoxy-D-manno-octulosonic acid transferase n=1 Tax=Solitalea koreensis TaxID=543615 RepID=A0A521CSB5_9SPHI|nr:glycosyltransferase N-terminal domain-containing protein [Solitalea koreensis]SMO62288.1 3-deoxy-D-manno-octulosonic-acid transferase [Solitalea koreensis]